MPYAPKRGCRHPGCAAYAEPGTAYCSKHGSQNKKEASASYEKSTDRIERSRKYDASWSAIRAAYYHRNPLCERCLAQGKIVVAQEVHHIRPLSQGGTHDEKNLISLCKSCHQYFHINVIGDRKPFKKIGEYKR